MPNEQEVAELKAAMDAKGEDWVREQLGLGYFGATHHWQYGLATQWLVGRSERLTEQYRSDVTRLATDANDLSRDAIVTARGAAAAAVGAFILSAIGFAKSMGWF